ncbi:winged helix-turn-helix transcriptional regulator [Streptomyces sp. NPDC088755]|uniref:winged helix-turn-helix transcriptional regulator n=1 Tax=Streptomyces sp. NPDC088755 TaxID=3365888 RepID=UPI0037FC31B3
MRGLCRMGGRLVEPIPGRCRTGSVEQRGRRSPRGRGGVDGGDGGDAEETVYPVVPPRVEYELTPRGATPHTTIRTLVDWTEDHQQEIAWARAEYDGRQGSESPAA